MSFSLRLLPRSRRLRAMSALAWLMLVVNSLNAAPIGSAGQLHSLPMQSAVAEANEDCLSHVAVKGSESCCDVHAGCCGGMTTHACHCAAMCSTVPPATAVALVSVATSRSCALLLVSSAPSLNIAPPLRPPAV